MLKLIIDGQDVVLPASFSAEYHITNPYFTREGEHTYDIELDITNPVNAKIYGHINRYDVVSWPKGRTAVLMTEQGTIMRGTEVLLEMDETSVKIQLVAGTSELNYISGKDMMLQDLGIATPRPQGNDALNSLSGSYPEWEYVCAPFCTYNETETKDYEFMANEEVPVSERNFFIYNHPDLVWAQGESGFANATLQIHFVKPLYYLAAYIDRLFRFFGYDIEENAIGNDPIWKKLIMMKVPRWTVAKFIEEVEKFCNVVFDVDNIRKIVNIRDAAEFYSSRQYEIIQSKDVVAPVRKKFDAEGIDDNRVVYENVHFNLENSIENNFRSLPDEVRSACSMVEVTENSQMGYMEKCFGNIWQTIFGSDAWIGEEGVPTQVITKSRMMVLYYAKIYNQFHKFLIRSTEEGMTTMRICDELEPVFSDNKNDLELNIIPTEMVSSYVQFDHSQGNDKGLQYPMPFVRGKKLEPAGKKGQRDGDTPLCDMIIDGPTETDDSEDKVMPVAFYFGMIPVNWEREESGAAWVSMPVASPFNEVMVVRKRIHNLPAEFWRNSKLAYLGNYALDMSLTGKNGLFNTRYSKNHTIDTTQQHIFSFRTKRILDARKIFVINNQKYYCLELKYTLQGKGLSEVVEGTFYPIQTTVGATVYNISVAVNVARSGVWIKVDQMLQYPIELTLNMTSSSGSSQLIIQMNAGTDRVNVYDPEIFRSTEFRTVLSHHQTADTATYNIITTINYPTGGYGGAR